MNTCLETPSGDSQAAPDDEVIRFSCGETLTVILNDYPFYCNGIVRSWSLKLRVFRRYRENDCSLSFRFSTLREDEDNLRLMAVGENNNKVSLELSGLEGIIDLNSSDILPHQRIEVQAGDVVLLLINFEGQCRSHENDGDLFTYALIGQQNTNGIVMYHKGGDGILMELRAWPFIAAAILGGIIIMYM